MTLASNSQILTVAQMQAAEQALIDGGETISTLMETAGAGAAEWIWRMAAGRSVTVLCGPGNNGGDGYVIARILRDRGLEVAVVAPLEPMTEAAIAASKAYGVAPVLDASHDILVDCLFGSGLARPLGGDLEALLHRLAAQHHLLVAIDLPSGVESDSGALLNADLPEYDLTIALGAWKYAHWLMPAMAGMGEKRLVDIGVGPVTGAAQLSVRPQMTAPAADAHKYTRGLLGVIGGAMPGASMLAARAAMYGGAGYVKLFATEWPQGAPDDLVVDCQNLPDALADVRLSALLVGPGLGRHDDARERLQAALARDLPTVCDADALVMLTPDMVDGRQNALILTPHAGELAHLCLNFAVAGENRISRLRSLATATNATVIAKGPDTLIATPDGTLTIMPPATSWLSVAGTGDVLAGLVASRLATGAAADMAAQQGLWLHASAASASGSAFSAGDVISNISNSYQSFL